MDPIEQVRAFAEATHLEEKWSSARQMMSSKAKPTQFEDFVDASASPKAKRLMLVIDAGAGTTDFALFQSFYDEKTESSSLALIQQSECPGLPGIDSIMRFGQCC
jgi:hypothetical protein